MLSVSSTAGTGFAVSHRDHSTGIKLTGDLNGWATTKDLILYLTGKLTVKVRNTRFQRDTILLLLREELAASLNTSVLESSINHVLVSLTS